MPELPEVETMVRGLRPVLQGRRLVGIRILDPLLLSAGKRELVEQATLGASVRAVSRRGKWVVIDLGSIRGSIVIQPRMTGGFWLVPPDRPDHVRLLFEVKGRREPVWFCDTRRLGRLAWYRDAAEMEAAIARSQGPDALEISALVLGERLKRTSRAIKPAIMDQKVVSGIGNIYADEILHAARIHPQTVASRLKPAEVSRIHECMVEVLRAAIAAEGSSFDAGYRTVLGQEGGFLTQNAVYGREGEPCKRCGRGVTRTRFPGLLGRSTYFCGSCQPARRRTREGRGGLNNLALAGFSEFG